MTATTSKEFSLFPNEAGGGAEQVRIFQRVTRVGNAHLLSLGIPHTEQRGNTQNLDMAEMLMKAMELHSPSPVLQVCWMEYPIDAIKKTSTDLVFVRIPFTIDRSRASVLIRLQTESGKGSQLQSTIVELLKRNSTRAETVKQLLAPSLLSDSDLSEMHTYGLVSISQSTFELSKQAYITNNPRVTYEKIKQDIVVSSGDKLRVGPTPIVSLDDFVSQSKFFRNDPTNS